jgi:hypothetical protein
MLASRWTRLAAGSDHANFTTNESSTTAVADAQSGFELERSDATSIRERASCGTAALTARRTDDSDGSGSQRMLDETTPSSHELPRCSIDGTLISSSLGRESPLTPETESESRFSTGQFRMRHEAMPKID